LPSKHADPTENFSNILGPALDEIGPFFVQIDQGAVHWLDPAALHVGELQSKL